MNQNKCTNNNCRQQEVKIPVGFFWSDITTQEFVIKSGGRIIKRFFGKVLIPVEVSQ